MKIQQKESQHGIGKTSQRIATNQSSQHATSIIVAEGQYWKRNQKVGSRREEELHDSIHHA